MFDFYFHYKYNGRFILSLKSFNILHTSDIETIKKIIVFFNINKIIDLSNNAILSYIYFFKYYFGVLPFFTNYQHEFKLNIHYFSFLIEYSFFNKIMYSHLFFFVNDIYYMINKLNIKKINKINNLEYIINDMNFFLEKKNSLGFYYLKHNLSFNLYSNNKINNFNLFYLFKLKDNIK